MKLSGLVVIFVCLLLIIPVFADDTTTSAETTSTTTTVEETTTTSIETTTTVEECVCTDDYEPVCGYDGVTYHNPCKAKCEGVDITHFSECNVCGDDICDPGEECDEDCKQKGYCDEKVACIGGDGCCPPGCEPCNDYDCGECRKECEPKNCGDDEIRRRGDIECPPSKPCPAKDGRTEYEVPCWWEGDECRCDECFGERREGEGPDDGCRREYDPKMGFTRVICERPDMGMDCERKIEEAKRNCENEGGRISFIEHDDGRCDEVECIFGDYERGGGYGFFGGKDMECPLWEEMERHKRKCLDAGGNPVLRYDGPCEYFDCVWEEERERCPDISWGDIERKKNECMSEGGWIVKEVDDKGCVFVNCVFDPANCQRDVPPEAYEKCDSDGGKLIVDYDEYGCIVFIDCVHRGDERRIRYKEIREDIGIADLMKITFKLDDLKRTLFELSKKTKGIAQYWESQGEDAEAARFKKASAMLKTIAEEEIDSIKSEIAGLAERGDLTVYDLESVRYSIASIKDVSLKNVLWVMLGADSSEFVVTPGEEVTGKDCGRNGFCFGMAMRSCEQATFYPDEEGPDGPDKITIVIEGTEGDKCKVVVKAQSRGFEAKALCLFPLGYMMRGPEDMENYCEGDLIEMMKMGPPPGERGRGPGPDDFDRGPRDRGSPRDDYERRAVGGDTDEHGCYLAAGYKWCDAKQRCIRDWEEDCEEECSGCLDNGRCDPGECMDCMDCR
jgi:hypothetical protein